MGERKATGGATAAPLTIPCFVYTMYERGARVFFYFRSCIAASFISLCACVPGHFHFAMSRGQLSTGATEPANLLYYGLPLAASISSPTPHPSPIHYPMYTHSLYRERDNIPRMAGYSPSRHHHYPAHVPYHLERFGGHIKR